MKKLFLSAIAVFAFGITNAQEGGLKAGVNVGFPMAGDAKDFYSLAIGVDAAYMWPVADQFQAGASIGYLTISAKETTVMGVKVKPDNAGYIPICATGQYSFSDTMFVGLDLGYAVAMAPSGADSGMIYQPKVGYQTEKYEIYAGFKTIAVSGASLSTLGLGFNYKF